MAESTRTTTIRIPESLAMKAELVAHFQGTSLSEVVRHALAQYVGAEQQTKTFRERLAQRIESDKNILDRLRDGETS